MLTVRYKVSGVVQGVGYRFFAQRTAIRLGISGHVRNRPDGTVEILAQSISTAQLAEFAQALWEGPSHAGVSGVEQEELSSFPAVLSGFEIRL